MGQMQAMAGGQAGRESTLNADAFLYVRTLQVCSTCHSMQYKSYRQLIGVSHTEEQAKAIARSIEVRLWTCWKK